MYSAFRSTVVVGVLLCWGTANAFAQMAPDELDPETAAKPPMGYGFAAASDATNYRKSESDPSWMSHTPAPAVAQRGTAYNYATDSISTRKFAAANSQPPPTPPNELGSIANQPASGNGQSATGQCANGACAGGSCATCSDCSSGSCDCNSGCCFPLIQIEDCCPLVCEDGEVKRCFADCCCLQCWNTTLTGFVAGGIMGNGRNTADRFNGPLTFPDRNGEGQLNQLWMTLDRSAPEDNCGMFIGGHVDYMYGSDYFFTTAAGLDGTSQGNVPRWDNNNFLYGSAMPQLYVETTFDTDLKIKFGHFFTIIGYEVVPAIGNFFYTHAYTMQYGEPFTHTGILASRTKDDWTWFAGITNGWDTFSADSRANFLGGLTYSDRDWGSLAFAITTGDNPTSAGPGVGPFANRTMYSLVWSRTLTSRLTYVLQHDYGVQDNIFQSGENADWYGINQYMFYKLNCCWSFGARIEWFRDDDGARVTGLRPGNAIAGASFPGNFYECTLGLNYKPTANFAVRPEVRWDWYEGQTNQNQSVAAQLPYDAGTRSNQFTFGLDLIYQF